MTAEEILTGIEIEQATDVNSERTLFYFDEVIKAMKIYANQKLDEVATEFERLKPSESLRDIVYLDGVKAVIESRKDDI